MAFLEFAFILLTLFLGWVLFGYFIFLSIKGAFRVRSKPEFPEKLPFLSVVISVYNEEKLIAEKLNNLEELDYPRDLFEIVFVDGGSTDRTVELLSGAIQGGSAVRLLNSPKRGKISQLNYVLPELKGEIVVNTDADGLLNREALLWVAAEFASDQRVYVVGAFTYPKSSLEAEHYYWAMQNKARLLETAAGSSLMVIAQCYAFKKEMIKAFPGDVFADDIYTSFLANSLGGKVVYSRYVTASELRTPQNYAEYMRHKLRKSLYVLKEFLRFARHLPKMDTYFKVCFITRFTQHILSPWACILWFLIGVILAISFRHNLVLMSAVFMGALFIAARQVFLSVELPHGKKKYSLLAVVSVYVRICVTMLSTALNYPFYSRYIAYERVDRQ